MRIAKKLAKAPFELDGATFTLKPLTGIEMLEVSDEAYIRDDGSVLVSAAGCKSAIKYGLVAWEGMTDENGAAVPFPVMVTDAVDMLHFTVIRDIATEIISRSEVTPDDKKK